MKTTGPRPLLLGSASERRRHLLGELGIAFSTAVPAVDEVLIDTDPEGTALENAVRKERWCRQRFPDSWIITADTVVSHDGHCIAKPSSMEEAANFLRRFSGTSQTIYTGLCLSSPDAPGHPRVIESSVIFRLLSERDVAAYLSHVNPLDKAGGYDIDQKGDLIIASHQGSYSNIMGLPMEVVTDWLRKERFL